MGFNKRIINKESILITEQERLDKLFDADALIMDIWASKFLQLHMKGHKKDEIIKMLEDESTES
jgi:hypothetical protein